MAFPTGWPPRLSSGVRSIRFFVTAAATANFDDRAYLFADDVGANPYLPTPVVSPGSSVSAAVGTTAAGGSPMGGGENDSQSTKKMIWAGTIRIKNDGAGDLEYSFDGTNVHGIVKEDEELIYRNRYEAGISVRGVAAATPSFRIEAW